MLKKQLAVFPLESTEEQLIAVTPGYATIGLAAPALAARWSVNTRRLGLAALAWFVPVEHMNGMLGTPLVDSPGQLLTATPAR